MKTQSMITEIFTDWFCNKEIENRIAVIQRYNRMLTKQMERGYYFKPMNHEKEMLP